jgi:FAD/FMN-containing dehydrogenase
MGGPENRRSSIAGDKVTNKHGIGLTRTGFHSLGLEVAHAELMRSIKEDVDPGMIFA